MICDDHNMYLFISNHTNTKFFVELMEFMYLYIHYEVSVEGKWVHISGWVTDRNLQQGDINKIFLIIVVQYFVLCPKQY